jgi:hypothetical protein
VALTRDQILNARDRQPTPFPVAEWGGDVYLAPLSAKEALEWSEAREKKDPQMIALLLVRAIVDEEGTRLFSDQDAPALMGKKATTLVELFERASDQNAVTRKKQDELRGNSSGDQVGASPTA